MSTIPEDIRKRVNEWISEQPKVPNPEDYVAVLPSIILGPYSADSEALQAAFEKGDGKQPAIIQLSEINTEHQQSVAGPQIKGRGVGPQ